MVLTMAFRNLGRHRVKTIITSVAVAVSVSLYIVADSWILGMNIDSRRNIIIYEMGAAKVQTSAYFNKKDDLPMYESFDRWAQVQQALEKSGYISTPRFVFTGTLYSGSGNAPILFNAIDIDGEKKLFRYADFVEYGRFPEKGKLEIAIGMNAAEKLKVGIPQRLEKDELEYELAALAGTEEDAAFIRGLYIPYRETGEKRQAFTYDDEETLDRRMVLRKDVTAEEFARVWSILKMTGRMDVRISTTIDIKALPEKVGTDKFERDVVPLFSDVEQKLLFAAYEKDELINSYLLRDIDNETEELILSRMLEADYSGAIRHVNQLIDAVVVGVINSPNPKNNSNIAYIPMDALQGEDGLMLNGHVTELLIRSAKAKDSELPGKFESPETIRKALVQAVVAQRFKDKGDKKAELSVYRWEDYAKDFLAASAGDRISTKVMIFFLFLLSFMGIANTMLMAILERTKEIGMMRALGMNELQLMVAYVTEAALIGLIGSTVGVIIGCLLNIPMVNVGIDYSAVTDAMSGDIGYRISSYFRSTWNIAGIIKTFFAAIFLSAAMAILPTRRALRLPVTEALRFE